MVGVRVNPDDIVVRELRAAGLRVTMPRQAVLTWLARHPHSTADAIAAGVREKFGALSLQAIYGVVRVSTEAGLLRRVEPAGHAARYERRVGDNHHHLVCRRWRPRAPWPERIITRRNGNDRLWRQADDDRCRGARRKR
jgi:Fe2+ or Zn2+ uptake regulation protein